MVQGTLDLRVEAQQNAVADEVSALTAVVRPILEGTLYALKHDIVMQAGGHEEITLAMLARLYRPGDGDCGLCFEWAIHDALSRKDALVMERVVDAIAKCKVPGNAPASILFGAEKTGALKLIDTAEGVLTDESKVLAGKAGRPVGLKKYIRLLAAAFRRPDVRLALPHSIHGLWKADLFVGNTDKDRWVGTTVKINPTHLEGAKGLRIGIVPSKQGRSDKIYKDEGKNLMICPIPHDASFMEIFYQAWGIVQQFIAADAHLPKEVNLPRPADRQVARYLEDRRNFPVLEVLQALVPLAQPELLKTSTRKADLLNDRDAGYNVGAVIAPSAKVVKLPPAT